MESSVDLDLLASLESVWIYTIFKTHLSKCDVHVLSDFCLILKVYFCLADYLDRLVNSVDPDQMLSSEASWSRCTVFSKRINPGSAGQGQKKTKLASVTTHMYSKTFCKMDTLKKTNILVFKTNYRLMHLKSIAECSPWSILRYFRPSLSYHLSLRSLFLSILEWPFYTSFTVSLLTFSSKKLLGGILLGVYLLRSGASLLSKHEK